MVEAPVPFRVGPARDSERLLVAVGDDDETADPDLRHPADVSSALAPDFAIAIGEDARFMGRVQADDIESPARGPLRALDGMDAIPDRRMRFLQRFKLYRNMIEREKLALEIERPLGEALEDEIERLRVNPLRILRLLSVERDLDGRGASAEADLEPSAA